MLRLLIVRHAETEWSRERRFAGWRDVPLTARGRRQSEAVARATAGLPVAAVHASPLERARATAGPIARAHALEVRLAPEFREMGFGEWEGLTREAAAARDPEAYRAWRSAPHLARIPGGEALADVAARVERGLGTLRRAHPDGVVVLVTHAIVARLLVVDALGLAPGRLWSVDASPAGITEVEYRDDWVTVHRLNTLAHLEPELALEARAS